VHQALTNLSTKKIPNEKRLRVQKLAKENNHNGKDSQENQMQFKINYLLEEVNLFKQKQLDAIPNKDKLLLVVKNEHNEQVYLP
jgi:hypothetical protein